MFPISKSLDFQPNSTETVTIEDEKKKTEKKSYHDIRIQETLKCRTDIILKEIPNVICSEIQLKNEIAPKEQGSVAKKLANEGNYGSELNKNKFKRNFWIQYTGGEGWSYGGQEQYPQGIPFNPDTRNRYIKTVFMILLLMLLATAIYLTIVFQIPSLKDFYIHAGTWFLIGSMGALIILNLITGCIPQAQHAPCSYICLVLAVIIMSNMAAAITVRYKTHIIAYALAATTVTVIVCIMLACTSFDFTKFYIYVVAISIVLAAVCVMLLIARFAFDVSYKPLTVAIIIISALLNVAMLLIELQMVIGGKSLELTEDDHSAGAYMLYMSIVSLFLNLLQAIDLIDS